MQNTDIKLPGEGWKPSEVTSYQLGLCTMDTMSLLECKRSITVVSPVVPSLEDKTMLYRSGLIASLPETENNDDPTNGELGDNITVKVKYTLEEL